MELSDGIVDPFSTIVSAWSVPGHQIILFFLVDEGLHPDSPDDYSLMDEAMEIFRRAFDLLTTETEALGGGYDLPLAEEMVGEDS